MKEELNAITDAIIGAAIDVHRSLGPGMLESSYDSCLFFELTKRSFHVERQKPMALNYQGRTLEIGYRLDMLVEEKVVVEVKAISCFRPVHSAQLLSYLRLAKCKVGLLLNFNVKRLAEDGIKRIVNDFPD